MMLVLVIVGIALVTTYMLEIGLSTPHGQLAEVARHKGELARAVVIMLVLGPLVARLVVALFALPVRPAVALVLLSLVGVVPLAPRGARGAKADVSFAVILTMVLGCVAAFTAAPSARLLLAYRGPLHVRTGELILQVALLQALPLGIGLALRSRISRARTFAKALAVLNRVLLLVVVVVALVELPRHGTVRSLGWSGAFAALVFAALIAIAAFLLAGPQRSVRRTLTSIANMPNILLAILIVRGAGVDAGFVIALIGAFLVRLFAGLALQKLLAHRASTSATHRGPGVLARARDST